ncbi:Aminotransferase class I/II-fold pyridoxal phosphate-dependent enzyme [Trichostrongylus colubriformis]|uniref:Aminotransferase class I/II-fold pyridoxal phosphate-dependent enzyme n=1 Tax=Trichostrongylus colubriformis TaxID=6319 RepID=A0AAN8FC73_TRICO
MSEFAYPPAENAARGRLGDEFDQLHSETRLAISHSSPLARAQPIVTPIYHSTTYRYDSVQQFNESNHGSNYVYQRCGNPTVENVEVVIRELEQGAATLLYNSGLAACTAVLLEFLSAGDHLICMKPMYSGSYSFITETLIRFNVSVDFVDVEKEKDFTSAVEKAIKKDTKMIFVEVIANPSMAMPNLAEISELASRKQVLSFVDATFASPICVQPILLGADFCMHSCSKYIGGHTDVIGGCVTTRTLDHWKRLKLQQLTTGSALSPFDAALLARGLKTLPLRVDKICTNADRIAQFLAKHPKVLHTHYPGLPSHPMHEAAKTFMKKWSGMIAFDVGSSQAAIIVVESVRLIIHAVSLGGTESLMEHALSMSHSSQLLRTETEPMVPPGLLRLSVGIENADDLIADLERALSLI